MFSSGSLTVSGLMFTSLTHFKVVLGSGVKEGSSVVLLHVAVQFSQHRLLRRLSPLYVFGFFVVNSWVCFWALDSVTLVCVSIFMPITYCFGYYGFVIQFEIGKHGACSLSQDRFG